MSFRSLRIYDEADPPRVRIELSDLESLSAGDVVLRTIHSSVNYKDALAVTGRGKILRRHPLVPGIDLAGVVESSQNERFQPGTAVLANGMGLGETRDGGFSERMRLPADLLMPLPEGLSSFEAMALGTAGFTAALALHRMEEMGQEPSKGPVAVTGASGGVGSIAVNLLASRGYEVIAVSGRREHHDSLGELGAGEVVTPEELELGSRPLEKARFGGVIDNVGGELLAGLIRHVDLWGNVASIGMASGHELATTVFPFILRGVNLLGASSANCPMPLRETIWSRLAGELKPKKLDAIVAETIGLEEIVDRSERILDRKSRGRIVVRLDGPEETS